MTTFEEIQDLQNYIGSNVGVSVKIGNFDLGPADYPVCLIIPDENANFIEPKQDRFATYNFGVKVKFIDTREEDRLINTLGFMDKFIRTINNFSGGKDHEVLEDFITEYTDNTYEITFVMNLRIRQQNT